MMNIARNCGKAVKVIETVNEHCKHEDCIYRLKFDLQGTDFCNYCVMEHQVRGCPISNCDKYRTGMRWATIERATLNIKWRIIDD